MTGDFNQDGRVDLATSSWNGSVSVLLANTSGGYDRTDYSVWKGTNSLATGDLNGDGRADFATTGSGFNANDPGTVSVLLANKGGGYTRNDYTVDTGPITVALGDLDGDGRLDIATANGQADSVSVLRATDVGGYTRTDYPVANGPYAVDIGDLNGDGVQDIVAVSSLIDTLSLLVANGAGEYDRTDYTVGPWANAVKIADVNKDGLADLVVSNYYRDAVAVLYARSTSPGDYGQAEYPVGHSPSSVAVADLNRDGIPDIVTANWSDSVTVLAGSVAGGYVRSDFPSGAGAVPVGVAVADVNGDSRPDLVTCDAAADTASVLLNTTNAPPVATDDSYSIDENSALSVATPGVLGNDSDPDGDSVAAAVVSGPSHGTLTLRTDGAFDYAPARDFNGTDMFTYQAGDGSAQSNVATVTITVNPVNSPPTVAVASEGTVTDGGAVFMFTVADADTPVENLVVTASSDNQSVVPDAGLTVGGSGAMRTMAVQPTLDSGGTAAVTVTVSDGQLTAATTVTVTTGTAGDDVITGTDGPDLILTGGGDDQIDALAGADLIATGEGSDLIYAGSGDDTVQGGRGDDYIDAQDGNDTVDGGRGDDYVYGADGADTLSGGYGDDLVSGGSGNDAVSGDNGDDYLVGGPGADAFSGGEGTDVVVDYTPSEGDTMTATP